MWLPSNCGGIGDAEGARHARSLLWLKCKIEPCPHFSSRKARTGSIAVPGSLWSFSITPFDSEGIWPCPHVHAPLTHGLAESKIDRHAGAARTLTKGSSSVMLQNGAHAGSV